MKVKINLKIGKEEDMTFPIRVSESDSACSVKERVALVQPIPFPDQDLMLGGRVLKDGENLCDCGVKEGASLDLVVKASEGTLVKQLTELLQARDLSCDELGMLYCYKHGASISQAFKAIGFDGKLGDFVAKQKTFALESSRVALVRKDTALKPFSVTSEIETILKATETGSMDMKGLDAKFLEKFNVSLASLVGGKPGDFIAKEKALFTLKGQGMVSLKNAKKAQKPKAEIAPCQPSCSYEACQPAVQPSWSAPQKAATSATSAVENQQYNELHDKISNRSFHSRAMQALNFIVDVMMETSFLNIDHIVKGGSIGKGTAITSCADAELVCFLVGLPITGHEKWLQPLLRSIAGVLTENVLTDSDCVESGFESVEVVDDCVRLSARGVITNVRFASVFESYDATIQELREQIPEARRFQAAALAMEKVQFISRQPSQVKVTIRLLKWWRNQHQWTSKLVRPSDDVLELMAVYSAEQTKPADQRQAIANVLFLMSRFNELRIVWSEYYSKDCIWEPLLSQRPLLMDPVNPFVNVADPQCFDARELMDVAKATHFFW
jgi:hypothetical protein